MKISLIICNRNEGKSLRSVIRNAKKYVYEVLVIDGHSTDQSGEIAKTEGARVLIDNGKGKGAAIRLGIQKANGDILVFMDADGSHDPNDIPRLVKPILQNQADLVLASRTKGGSDELNGSVEKTIRVIGSAIITQIINSRFHTDITDSQNGLRAIRKNVAKKLSLKENVFTIEQEMIIKTLKQGHKITEVAIHEYSRVHGHSHIRLSTMSWRYIWCLVKNIV